MHGALRCRAGDVGPRPVNRTPYDALLQATAAIEAQWRSVDNECDAFADIVWRVTDGLDLSAFGDLTYLTELLTLPQIAALQHPSTFSDLYLKLFDNGRFWVEVLNWWGSDINVHDHNFSGVQFQLTGRSLNVVYRYEAEATLSDITLGHLAVGRAELWRQGVRSIVRPGAAEPHNVSHLDVPTVSLLIRTHPVARYGHQNNYLAPDVTGNYSVADIVFRKKVGALRLMAKGRPEAFSKAFRHVLAHQTHAENLFTMLKMMDILFRAEHTHLLEAYAEEGELESRLVRAVAFSRAQNYLTNGLKYVDDLTDEEVLLVSALASSFDEPSLAHITADLARDGHSLDCELMGSMRSKLASADQRQLDSILALYELEPSLAPA